MLQVLRSIKTRFFNNKPAVEVERRSLAAKASSPSFGEFIVHQCLMMKVTGRIEKELWKWLAAHGWRVLAYPKNRRNYVSLPPDTFSRLELTAPSERAMFVRSLLRRWKDQ